jgi:hypothetical protein
VCIAIAITGMITADARYRRTLLAGEVESSNARVDALLGSSAWPAAAEAFRRGNRAGRRQRASGNIAPMLGGAAKLCYQRLAPPPLAVFFCAKMRNAADWTLHVLHMMTAEIDRRRHYRECHLARVSAGRLSDRPPAGALMALVPAAWQSACRRMGAPSSPIGPMTKQVLAVTPLPSCKKHRRGYRSLENGSRTSGL